MARILAVLGALAVVAAYFGLTSGDAHAAVDGHALYQRDCAFCHGATGRGTHYGPSLHGVGRAAVDYYVSTGRMPLVHTARSDEPGRTRTLAPGRFAPDDDLKVTRHTPPYTSDEMRALIDYATSLTGSGPSVDGLFLAGGDVSRGGEIFRLNCAACHSWAGEGGALLHLEAPALRAATARQTAEAVRVGPGNMPAFGTAALTDGQLADLVAYVHQLQHPVDPGGSALWHLGPVAEGAVALLAGLGALIGLVRWMGERG
ncbi:MAG TPA: c-type cytochrome [Acidimicrobiales bacterium]|nr:c-type cytochrome [Acidimicrobiales bacterium]